MAVAAGVIKKLNAFLEQGTEGGSSVVKNSNGDHTKYPHVAVAVMLLLEGRGKTGPNVNKAFADAVGELQYKRYLKPGTVKSTAKGIRMAHDLSMTKGYRELMDEYEKMLKKIRKGAPRPYRGPVPFR